MCSMSLLCPLCAQSSFATIDELRVSLIKAANEPLACPICQQLFLGLDKLTIHLFSHTSIMRAAHNDRHTQVHQQQQPTAIPTSPALTTTTAVAAVNTADEAIVLSRAPSLSPQCEKKSKKLRHNTPSHETQQAQHSLEPPLKASETPLSVCDICEFTFRNDQLREMHFRLVHQNPNSAQEHEVCAPLLTPAEPDFKCHLCSKTFKMKGSLRVHLKVVHQMGLPYVNNSPKLSICDRIRHKEVKSRINSELVGGALNTAKYSPPPPQPAAPAPASVTATTNGYSDTLNLLPVVAGGVLSINSCGELVQNSDSNVLLVLNANTSTPPTAHNCKLNSFAVQLEEEPETGGGGTGKTTADNPKIWVCDVCAKSFTTKYFLKKHKRLHTGEMPYTCEICARTFTFQQSYHKHLLYHSNEKPHGCTICGRAFKELSTLQNHARIHSGEKPFKCEVCGKCFRQRVSFLVHTRIHTGVMPYKCDVCQKSFRYKVSQRTHKCLPMTPDVDANADDEVTHDDDEAVTTPTGTGTVAFTDHDQDPISESFIKAFLESTTGHQAQSSSARTVNDNLTAACDCDSSLESKTMLEKAIDDIVVESCNKMGIGNEPMPVVSATEAQQHLSYVPTQSYNDGSNSPTQQLQNMRLYSPQATASDAMESADNEFPQFLLDDTSLMLSIDPTIRAPPYLIDK